MPELSCVGCFVCSMLPKSSNPASALHGSMVQSKSAQVHHDDNNLNTRQISQPTFIRTRDQSYNHGNAVVSQLDLASVYIRDASRFRDAIWKVSTQVPTLPPGQTVFPRC